MVLGGLLGVNKNEFPTELAAPAGCGGHRNAPMTGFRISVFISIAQLKYILAAVQFSSISVHGMLVSQL